MDFFPIGISKKNVKRVGDYLGGGGGGRRGLLYAK